ncbi:MAG: class I mannose-6-phosphate isomerase, partial [Bacteroidales bacterium]|nr:class I mannose-6-phosphate isomerase [Bacteroidales bacterium]
MIRLYPLRFNPAIKEKVWGGKRLAKEFGKSASPEAFAGESWEISGLRGDESIISNGFLKDNNINEVVETYLGEIVGDEIYDTFSDEFPLLIKLLDIEKPLSLQVHPDDQTALWRHDSYGKTEFWYILDAEPDACIYLGLNRDTTPSEFYQKCGDESIIELLNVIHPKRGDFFMIEPGTLHSAKGGVVVAEIQQPSDITYRVFDWGREHDPSAAREMHLDMAIDCINYQIHRQRVENISACKREKARSLLTDCKYFKISLLEPEKELSLVSQNFNSFIIYLCESGKA